MDVKDHLDQLPEPDPAALERVWHRFRQSRAEQAPRAAWRGWGVGASVALAAAVIGVFVLPAMDEGPRREVLRSGDAIATADWSDEVHLTIEGRGEIAGTTKDAVVEWQSGTVTASVVPSSGNALRVVTEEAIVEVVGTVFSVHRDALGTSTTVQEGRVKVTCTKGGTAEVGPEDGVRVCLPVRPASLLGRFHRLRDDGADAATQLATLDAGLTVATPGSAAEEQLLLGRMELRADAGDLDEMLADADRYFAVPRSREVHARQLVSRRVLASTDDCEVALPHLAALEHTGTPVDRTFLARCLLTEQPKRAAQLLDDAIPQLDGEWRSRAEGMRAVLP